MKVDILKLSFPGALGLQENAKIIVALVIIFLSAVHNMSLNYSLCEFRRTGQLLDTIDCL